MNKFLLVDSGLYLAVARKKKGWKQLKKGRQNRQKIVNQLMNVNPVQHINSHFSWYLQFL